MASICGRRRSNSGVASSPVGLQEAMIVWIRSRERTTVFSHTVSKPLTTWAAGTASSSTGLQTFMSCRLPTSPRSSSVARARIGSSRMPSRKRPT